MIGCGFVGSASVFALMQSGLFTEIVLIDADKNKAEGEAMDISHGIPFDGVSLSMPAIVGADGIESDIPINLSGEEALKLKESADSLKKIMETIEL